MKTAITRAGKLGGIFLLALALAGCPRPGASPLAPDGMRKSMDAGGGAKERGSQDPFFSYSGVHF
jgi:hypothetical protein